MNTTTNADIDARNSEFWNELCGSHLARTLGVTDSSPASLKRFDDWYMDFYPYLYQHIPFGEMRGKKVLDVGLGYGTIAQKLAEAGCDYQGLDIAAGPVNMVNHRLAQMGLPGQATQASVLNCPFPDETFDWVVAIGCFHHTGNLQRALDEAWRVLKPGGQAMVMVYYAYSYRRWLDYFRPTLRHLLWEKFKLGNEPQADESERAHYDASEDGGGAPATAFTSAAQMRQMCAKWSQVKVQPENTGGEGLLRYLSRETANNTVGKVLGLDIYCRLSK